MTLKLTPQLSDTGNYTVTCTVTDDGNPAKSSSISFKIQVYYIPPPPPPPPVPKGYKAIYINNVELVVEKKYKQPYIFDITDEGLVTVDFTYTLRNISNMTIINSTSL